MRHLTTSDNEVKQFLFKDTSIEVVDEQARTELNNLSAVAKSGDYDDLNNKPSLATVATTGNYNDLIDKPSLATVATTGDYDDLNNKPSLATVATTGDYNDLVDKPSLATVATTGDYDDLNNKPSLATVATTGDYDDLTNKPTIPVVNNATLTIQKNGTNVQTFTANASSNVTANITMDKSDVGLGDVGNFKAVSTVANQGLTEDEKGNARSNIGAGSSSFSGDYNDLSNKPALKAVATSGSYNDLTNKPTIPTVNNATLTIQKNGTNVQTFTANSSSDKTANITVPTKVSELTNDSGFITDAGVTGVKGSSETNYRTGNVDITKANIGLGNVPNVSTNNQTPTFTQANTRANIASGETLTVILGKIMKFFADLKSVAFSGSYADLSNKPTIPTVNNATLTIQKNGTNVQTFTANQSTNATANITMSKSDVGLGNVGNFKAVSTVASQGLTDTEKSNARANIGAGTSSFSGSYTDLTNKPTIPTVNNATLTIQKNGTTVKTFTANASSNVTANITMSKSDVGLGNVGNFKAVSTVASQGLTDTEKSNARANIGAGTSSFSGSYTDLTNKPTIPTVNNATLTIQKNGTTVKTFTANASSNVTANITVPTKVSELTNDSDYLKNGGKGNSSTQLTLNQQYTFTQDGYCVLMSGAAAGTTIVVALYGTDGVSLGSYFLCTPVNGYGSSIPFYVKKGFKVTATRIDSGCAAYAVPIKY